MTSKRKRKRANANNGGTPFFNDNHDREKYNADITADHRSTDETLQPDGTHELKVDRSSVRYLTVEECYAAYERWATRQSIRRLGRVIAARKGQQE